MYYVILYSVIPYSAVLYCIVCNVLNSSGKYLADQDYKNALFCYDNVLVSSMGKTLNIKTEWYTSPYISLLPPLLYIYFSSSSYFPSYSVSSSFLQLPSANGTKEIIWNNNLIILTRKFSSLLSSNCGEMVFISYILDSKWSRTRNRGIRNWIFHRTLSLVSTCFV